MPVNSLFTVELFFGFPVLLLAAVSFPLTVHFPLVDLPQLKEQLIEALHFRDIHIGPRFRLTVNEKQKKEKLFTHLTCLKNRQTTNGVKNIAIQ